MSAKAAYLLGQEGYTFWGLLRDLSILAKADILFTISVGILGLLTQFPRSLAWRRRLWLAWLAFGVICVAYAVASVQIFKFLRTPLTWSLLYLAGEPKNVQSSVSAFISPALLAAFVLSPVVFCLFTWHVNRRANRPGRAFSKVRLACVAPAILALGYVQATGAAHWSDRDDRRILHNPHWVWISTCAAELLGQEGVHLSTAYTPEHLADFQTFGQRNAPLSPTLQLARRPRNVILVVLESVGTQQMSLYGSKYKTTPNLEALAKEGIVFDNYYSHMGNSANAFVAMALSAYPPLSWREFTRDRPDTPGVALGQAMQQAGRKTGFINLTDNSYANMGRFAQSRGFDVIWDYRQIREAEETSSWGAADRHLVDGTLQFLDRFPNDPFFLMLWTQQTHHPYEPAHDQKMIDFFEGGPLPYDDYSLGRYLNCLHEADAQIGRLMNELRARGLADDTLLVVVGDHGEGFGEPHPTFGHGQQLYDECVRVPCLMRYPGLPNLGMRSSVAGAHIDLNPTILDILGLPASPAWQGRSLLGPAPRERSYFFAATTDYMLGVRDGPWKYILNATLAREELFNLEEDPQELRNLASARPDQCARLKPYLAAWVAYQRDAYGLVPR